jgi:hypothetical protein
MAGPARPAEDALADERRLAALIRQKQGVVALSDLVGLFGWTPAEADTEVTRILCDYGGDVVVEDDGAILYRFDDPNAVSGALAPTGSLLVTAGVETAMPARVRPPPERFFPGAGSAAAIILVAVLAFAALGVLLHPALPLLPGPGELAPVMPELVTENGPVRLFGLGLWPQAVLFGALALRLPLYLWRRGRERARAALEPYLAVAANSPAGAPLDNADLAIVARLGGDYDAGRLSFPELARAVAAAERWRAHGRSKRSA